MGDSEKISVVMCTYNGARYLDAQLESILAQTLPASEIVICDDASTDTTVAIVRRFADKDNRIRLYVNDIRLGCSKNFEQAIGLASGSVISFADQDDIWLPQKLERLMAAWPADSPAIYCDSQRFEKTLPVHASENPLYRRFSGDDASRLFLYNTVSGHALICRRSFLQKILPFQEPLYYDWNIGVLAACHGGITYCNETLVLQRIHDHNASVIRSKGRREAVKWQRKVAMQHLNYFVGIKGISAQYLQLAQKLHRLLVLRDLNQKRLALLCLLMFHRKKLFSSKRRLWEFPSHLKLAYRWAYW